MTCVFCGRAAPEAVSLELHGAESCPGCLVRLGRTLVDAPLLLAGVWPVLAEPEDDGHSEPEPKVHMPDGRVVELKDRTAELKRDLRPEQRLQLARNLGLLGMHREQVLEVGHVLAAEPPLR